MSYCYYDISGTLVNDFESTSGIRSHCSTKEYENYHHSMGKENTSANLFIMVLLKYLGGGETN